MNAWLLKNDNTNFYAIFDNYLNKTMDDLVDFIKIEYSDPVAEKRLREIIRYNLINE